MSNQDPSLQDSVTPDIDLGADPVPNSQAIPTQAHLATSVIQTVHPPVVKGMIVAGIASVLTANIACLIYFVTMFLQVWHNGQWPPSPVLATLVVLIGPVLTAWQFMGVRKILTSLLSTDNGLGIGMVVRNVVAAKMGFVPAAMQPDKPYYQVSPSNQPPSTFTPPPPPVMPDPNQPAP